MGPHLDVWYGTVPNHDMAIMVREPTKAKLYSAKKVLYLLWLSYYEACGGSATVRIGLLTPPPTYYGSTQ